MRKLRALFVRFAHLLRVRPSDSEFVDELESHIAMHVDECVRAGMNAEGARRDALIHLGGAEQTRQALRDRNTLLMAALRRE